MECWAVAALTRFNCLYRSTNTPQLSIARGDLGTAQEFVESLHRKLSESSRYLSCHVDAAQTHIAEVIGYVNDRPRPDSIVRINFSSHHLLPCAEDMTLQSWLGDNLCYAFFLVSRFGIEILYLTVFLK